MKDKEIAFGRLKQKENLFNRPDITPSDSQRQELKSQINNAEREINQLKTDLTKFRPATADREALALSEALGKEKEIAKGIGGPEPNSLGAAAGGKNFGNSDNPFPNAKHGDIAEV